MRQNSARGGRGFKFGFGFRMVCFGGLRTAGVAGVDAGVTAVDVAVEAD